MIVPDVNLLLYSYDVDSRFHAAAARWWETCLSGDEAVGLAPVVLFAFLRLATSRHVFDDPMTRSRPPATFAHGPRSRRSGSWSRPSTTSNVSAACSSRSAWAAIS